MAVNKQTQAQRVLSYMEEVGSITQIEALSELGVMRLASRITDLRKRGYEIESSRDKVKNRYGENCYIKRYRLADAEG
ncbi:MAG: helix-turn-helix domain-containing protein [Lentisphaeria bacterium]|nr:helix-turn-helix domain-containing protein [Lentisphaeria bacterium]